MAERVRMRPLRHARAPEVRVESEADPPRPESPAAPVQVQGVGRGSAVPGRAREEHGPPLGEVVGERGTRGTTEHPDPLPAPLAENPDLAPSQVEAAERGGGKLRDAEARSVR